VTGPPGDAARDSGVTFPSTLRLPAVEPLLVLVVLPVAIGALAEAAFRDAKRASLAAAAGSLVAVCVAVQALDRDASYSWLAAALVSPLPVALAVGTVLFLYGRTTARRHRRHHGA
jgi:cytochrome bd-type quinol oxidase subunit 2